MRWLQWSTIDLEGGLGGVELHARSLARELKGLGHEVAFSRDPRELRSGDWDVVQTHGSALPALHPLTLPRRSRPLRIHTLHGTTLGRMAACREWSWIGGYQASAREYRGVLDAQLILVVNPDLLLAQAARRLGKTVVFCENGWDAGTQPEKLPEGLTRRLPAPGTFWVFVGRGDDRVKAVDRIIQVLHQDSKLRLVAAPGDGFESEPEVIRTERLTPGQVLSLYEKARGLLIPSRYEGNSLAILEALSSGAPVVSTPVGCAPFYDRRVQGLVLARSGSPAEILKALREAEALALDEKSRNQRALHNRGVIPTWKKVAETAVQAVQAEMAKRGQG